ncbi:MAG: ABC transporter permease, partial [Bacteroidota bacterium]
MKNKEAIPPKWADKLLELVCANDQLEIIQGDLYELYAMRLASHSRLYANLYFIKDVIDLIVRPFIWKSRKSVYPSGSMAIYNNYLKVGFRNILKHKGYSFLNISGLSVGLCSFLLIFLFVYDEWSYDRYHDNASEIYRVTVKEHDLSDNVVGHYSYASPRQAPMLKENLPEVIEAVRFYPWNFPVISHEDKEFQENTFVFAEQSIFDIFSFNFIEGNAQTALVDPNTVVTTKSTAEKYFGDHSALGKRVNYKGFAGEERLLEVTGVVEDFPEQSHIDHAFIGSFVTLESTGRSGEFDDYIGNYNYPSYVKVAKEPDSKILASKIPNLLDQYIGQVGDRKASDKIRIYLQPLTDIHLGIGLPGGAGSTGNAF